MTDENTGIQWERMDGLANVMTGMGTSGYDPNYGMNIYPKLQGMTREQQDAYVREYGICRKVVHNIPNAATSKWGRVQIAEGDPELIKKITTALDEIPVSLVINEAMGAQKAFNQAMKAAFKSGNGAILLDVDDGLSPSEPMDESKIKSVRRLWVCDRWRLMPNIAQMDSITGFQHYLLYPGFGWGVQVMGRASLVHKSRVLWFRGSELNDQSLYQNQGCDDCILESLLRAFNLYQTAVEGAGRMIHDYDVVIHSIQGLLEKLSSANPTKVENTLRERLRVNLQSRSVYRGMVIDKDHESISHDTRSAGGYDGLVGTVKDYFLASTDYPPAVLFGEFASGLNASGKETSEKQLWNETISQVQSDKMHSHMLKLLRVLCSAKDSPTKGKIPEGLGWKWNPVYAPTPNEQAELEQQRAQIAQTWAQLDQGFGLVALKSHYAGTDYNPDVTLPEDYVKALDRNIENATKEQPEGAEGGMPGMPGAEGAAPPEGEAPAAEAAPEPDPEAFANFTDEDWQRYIETGEMPPPAEGGEESPPAEEAEPAADEEEDDFSLEELGVDESVLDSADEPYFDGGAWRFDATGGNASTLKPMAATVVVPSSARAILRQIKPR